ncbi:MAG: sporulation membrane protein YtaF [Peptococcaceae bacterium]|nr:sporulation membrane protein YtaF [Peptococcaceae bacterium]
MLWSVVVLALALSLDGLGVGLAYGCRKIKIPLSSLMTIAICSMLAMALSMFAGHGIASIAKGIHTSSIGAVILMLVGLWQLSQAYLHRSQMDEAVPAFSSNTLALHEDVLFKISLKPIGLVIQVLRTPAVADMDGSGAINFREALLLGLALNLDACGAGFGAAMAGFSLGVIPMVALCQVVMVALGRSLSAKFIPLSISQRFAFLPGLVLVTIGLFKLWT